jgi:hypothetical protein
MNLAAAAPHSSKMTQIPKASDFSPDAYEKRGETVSFAGVEAG